MILTYLILLPILQIINIIIKYILYICNTVIYIFIQKNIFGFILIVKLIQLSLQCSLKNDSMLHGQARLIVQDNKAAKQEIELAIGNLKDGDYTILIMDDTKNKSLPQLKYLFGVDNFRTIAYTPASRCPIQIF